MIPDQECNQDQETLPLTPSTCTDPTPPPHPLSMNQRRNFYWAEGGLYTGYWHRASPTPSRPGKDADEQQVLHWCIYDYSFSMPGWKETTQRKCFICFKQHNVAFTNINVIEVKLSEERSRWKLEIILFSVDWAEVTITFSRTWYIEVKHMPEIFSWTLCNLTLKVLV